MELNERSVCTMRYSCLRVVAAITILAVPYAARCENVTGTILIKKRLTKRSVTAAVPVYQRGTAVKLGRDSETDPLAFERTRVVIYLEGGGQVDNTQAKAAGLQVQQMDRRFLPDLVVIPVGTTVSFPNMDPIFHNIFSLSKPKAFDLGSYDKGESRIVAFPKPGIVDVYCHLHPNMAATIVVTPNRWYARSDREGHYQISDVPPGTYTVVTWHKSAGFFRKSIVVRPGQNATADFFVPIDVNGSVVPPSEDSADMAAGSR
jgi:plastocyanin